MRVWIAEKAPQAEDIARVLGNPRRGDSFFDTDQGRVVFARGHLLEQAPPQHYDARWEQWTLDSLPLVPPRWDLQPRNADARKLVAVIRDAVARASSVVIATDPDREGECIARELLEAFRYKGPIQRLWLKGLDDHSIRNALGALRADAETRPLYWAALARSRADWIWGLSLTRLMSLLAQARGSRGVRPVGRVQSPTLYLVYARCVAIETFVPRGYFELAARLRVGKDVIVLRHAPSTYAEDSRIYERSVAEALQQQATGAEGPLRVTTERKRQGPPALFSLSGLQKACNARFGWPADRTLEVAQRLYDAKATTYPRTDCPFLPMEQAHEIPRVLEAIVGAAPGLAPVVSRVANPIVRKALWDTSKVTAHHAIIPTMTAVAVDGLGVDERKAYDLIARQFVAALMPDFEFDEARIDMSANGVPFSAVGRTPRVDGWKAAFGVSGIDADEDADAPLPPLPVVADGARARVEGVDIESKQTQPPRPYTDATLLGDMENVAKFATDERIKRALKAAAGLGTDATRAGVIKELKKRGFIEVKGKNLLISSSGRQLVESLPKVVCDPSMTGVWESRLEHLASSAGSLAEVDEFVRQVAAQTAKICEAMKARAATLPPPSEAERQDGPPTARMLSAARFAAKQRGHKTLPPDVLKSFRACKAYLDVSIEDVRARASTNRPSDRAIQYAQQLAGELLCPVPPEVLQDRKALSDFIETLKSQKGVA